jgi:Mg/Co/Ni transporter MgtE
VNTTRAANTVVVSLGGQDVTGRAGTLVVAELADRLGLTAALSEGMLPLVQRARRRDPGVALTHLATLLVDGGDCLSDLAVLRHEPDLFGHVASAWRVRLGSSFCRSRR